MRDSKEEVIQPFSLLMVGPPFSGKTVNLMQFPGLYILDCDDKLSSGRAFFPNKKFFYDRLIADDKDHPVDVSERWRHAVRKIDAACKDPRIKTIGIDSLTELGNALQDHLTINGTTKLVNAGVKLMDQASWRPFSVLMRGLFNLIRGQGKYLVVNAHENHRLKEDGSLDAIEIGISGALKHSIGGMFQNVWQCYTVNVPSTEPGKPPTLMYRVRTRPLHKFAALGTTNQNVPADITFNYKTIAQVFGLPLEDTLT
jgi:hypothetical protein